MRYGPAGTIDHEAIEHYVNGKIDIFTQVRKIWVWPWGLRTSMDVLELVVYLFSEAKHRLRPDSIRVQHELGRIPERPDIRNLSDWRGFEHTRVMRVLTTALVVASVV